MKAKYRAVKDGFFDGVRVREGSTFTAPQGLKGSWFTPAGKEAPILEQPAASGNKDADQNEAPKVESPKVESSEAGAVAKGKAFPKKATDGLI